MTIAPSATVRQILLEIPGAARPLELAGIARCCGDTRTLEEACRIAGEPVEQVQLLLQRLAEPADEAREAEERYAELTNV